MSQSMTKQLTPTPSGFFAPYGGGWEQIPQPPRWFATSVQVCGIYPFGVGTGRPTNGAPLGRDMNTGSAVCTDHDALYRANVISSPSAFLFGLNGLGKSSTAQTLLGGQVGRGLTPAIFDPIKGEHVPWVESLGGTVFSIGPRARHQLNLLSPGPLGYAARRIGGNVGEELLLLARAKSIDLVKLVVKISRGTSEPVKDFEETAIEAIVDTILEHTAPSEVAVTADLIRAFESPSLLMMQRTGTDSAEEFHQEYKRLGQTLRSLMTGDLGQMLSGTNSVEFEPGNPGGFCFDTSSINEKNTKLLSAAMLSTWSLGMDAIDAHWELAQHELALQAEAHANGQRYEPAYTWGGYTSLMDEFWAPIRFCEGMVDLVDGLTRTNRSVGTAELKVSHSPKDLLSLPNAADREKARGFIERSGLLLLMGLSRDDLLELSRVRPLTPSEINQVAGFAQAKNWTGNTRQKGDKGAPPGAGKVLLKISERVGIPVKMLRTATQMAVHDTDTRYQQ
ncbi:ATP-binding protein [Curtobacterium poinsettiae]|uniref:ATP-binding protein n=1 Tax=Curtobacterium poinsettiae TaxID=159612 RepID=UPI00235EED8B|nr:ATP-binding protein [Curtobacterium flaccumfaciens]MDD1386838.1 ATP-binding protein [Curtobacterium flaccumfaciens pv. poinsettiae]